MAESKRYHYWKDGNEYDVVVYLDDEGKGDGYGHGIRTETTMKHWQGNEFVTREDIYGNVVYTKVTADDGSHIEKYQDASGRWWRESIGADGKGVRETIDEWDGDYPDDSGENVDNWRNPEEGETPIGRISQGQGEEPSPYDGLEDKNYAEDYLNPYSPDGQEENLAQDHLPSPDTGIQGVENHAAGRLPGPVEEPAPAPPAPGPEIQENYAKNYGFPGLVAEPPAEQYPPAEQPVQPAPGGEGLPDGNANGIPGEYGDGPDLDANGIPDEVGINPDNQQPGYPGGLPDGDANGIPGEYGDGPDLDGNGVPDEIGINPDSLQAGYPDSPATLGEWGGVGVPDPTVVPQSDATTTGAEAEYGDGSAPDGDWVPEETGIDPYALQYPAYADPSTSGDETGDPYAGSSFEPYVPPEEAPLEEEAPVPEAEDPDGLGSF